MSKKRRKTHSEHSHTSYPRPDFRPLDYQMPSGNDDSPDLPTGFGSGTDEIARKVYIGDTKWLLPHFEGCLLGGAMGDALGGPVEFSSTMPVNGVRHLTSSALITDDTQMTMFGAEAIIRSRQSARGLLAETRAAYQRWLTTQTTWQSTDFDVKLAVTAKAGLLELPWLYSMRAPGMTCMNGLRSGKPVMHSKGNGGVMRAAPFGLQLGKSPRKCFHDAVDAAFITHGMAEGYLPAGALAAILRCLLQGLSLERACYQALDILRDWKNSAETARHIRLALGLALSAKPGVRGLKAWQDHSRWMKVIGEGWVGEEALGIAIFCSLVTARAGGTFLDAISMAVSHRGDSDSTGAITGNIAGLMAGTEGLPATWAEKLEHGLAAPVLKSLARQLLEG